METMSNIPSKGTKKRVVIVGGGFGGLKLARRLNDRDFQVILLDRNNYHLFQPLLYQVATSGIERSLFLSERFSRDDMIFMCGYARQRG